MRWRRWTSVVWDAPIVWISRKASPYAASITVPATTAPARPNRLLGLRRDLGCGALASWPGVRAVFEDQIACNIVARSEGIRTP